MDVRVDDDGPARLIQLSGRLDGQTAPDLEKACAEWLDTPTRSPCLRAVAAQMPTMSFFGPTLTEFQA